VGKRRYDKKPRRFYHRKPARFFKTALVLSQKTGAVFQEPGVLFQDDPKCVVKPPYRAAETHKSLD
jgi:hypothetical protein